MDCDQCPVLIVKFLIADDKVLPADSPKKSIGWTMHENIGVGIINSGVVTRLNLGLGLDPIFEIVHPALGDLSAVWNEKDGVYGIIRQTPEVKYPLSPLQASQLSVFSFHPNGECVHQRELLITPEDIWGLIKDLVVVHQIQTS